MESLVLVPPQANASEHNPTPKQQGVDLANSSSWHRHGKWFGYRQQASIINTYDRMQDADVNTNVILHYVNGGTIDFVNVDASDCMPVENIGQALRYEGRLWKEWLRRVSVNEGKRLHLMHIERGGPEVLSLM